MRYWILLKNGDLRTQERKPKNKMCVEETSTERKGEWQMYDHKFVLYNVEGNAIGTAEMTTCCGYDRGPKRTAFVRNIFACVK